MMALSWNDLTPEEQDALVALSLVTARPTTTYPPRAAALANRLPVNIDPQRLSGAIVLRTCDMRHRYADPETNVSRVE